MLSTRNQKHCGALSNVTDVTLRCSLNGPNELSFQVYKELSGHEEPLWDALSDLKLIWVKELNEYYEITVSLQDESVVCKSVTGLSLCESELSQTSLNNVEINTEDDIAREDYVVTRFYDGENPKGSLLHRILSKAPHYQLRHVDPSLKNLQRSFSVNGTSIYDFLVGECAEQFHCLFTFDSTDRSISAYDLYTVCLDCGCRGEWTGPCPECGSANITCYGEDTTIYVDKENLTDSIHFTTDVEHMKNCFRLQAGDDTMTAMIRNCNPNGTDYIYRISAGQETDMSPELVERIHAYDRLQLSYTEEYSRLMNDIYDCIDQILYYTSGMMPAREHEVTTAAVEAARLTAANMSPVGLPAVTRSTSLATVNSALRNYAKVYVRTGFFKVEINDSRFTYGGTDAAGNQYGSWYGNFKVTNYSDEEDTALSPYITVKVTDMYETFLKQKLEKSIAGDDSDDRSIFDVLAIQKLSDFKKALTYYCLNRLVSFQDAIQGVIDIMVEEDQAGQSADLYDKLYLPYYNKLTACQKEIDRRQAAIDSCNHTRDTLELRKQEIQAALNFETFLGEELYREFCAYRREDTYTNENYISDGLDNAGLFAHAREFLETAKKEILKASEPQHSISASLHNLLVMPQFAPLSDKFQVGNWIRLGVDGVVYRLRLVHYEILFSDIQTLTVEFSDLTVSPGVSSDVKSILDSAKSMASSFSYVSQQLKKEQEAQEQKISWVDKGLDSTLVRIKSNDAEEVTYDRHGILCRSYDDITDSYGNEQLKITHNILAFTKDGWQTSSLGLGKHHYTYYDEAAKAFQTRIDYGLSAKFVQAGYVYGSQIVGGDIYSENYAPTTGTHINLNQGTFSFAGGKFSYDGAKLKLDGEIVANSGLISGLNIDSTALYNGTNSMSSTKAGVYIGSDGIRQYASKDAYVNMQNGKLTCVGAEVTGKIYANNGLYLPNSTSVSKTGYFLAIQTNNNFSQNCIGLTTSAYVNGNVIASGSGSFSSYVTANSLNPLSTGSSSIGSDTSYWGKIYGGDWFRSIGNTGWYSQTYGGGICMTDSSYIRTYGSKHFLCDREIISTNANGFRIVQGDYGALLRMDGSSFYLLFTNKQDPYGSYNSLRPISISRSNGHVHFAHDVSMNAAVTIHGPVAAMSLETSGGIVGYGGVYWANQRCVYSDDNSIVYLTDAGSYLHIGTASNGAFGIDWFPSDSRLKKDIAPTQVSGIDFVRQLNHVEFNWKDPKRGAKTKVGYLAHELQDLDPCTVNAIPQPEDSEYEELLQINQTKLIPYLSKAIQELIGLVEQQQQEIEHLKQK